MTTDLTLNHNLRTAVEINDVVLKPNTINSSISFISNAHTIKVNCQLSIDMLMLRNLIKLSGDLQEAMQEGGNAWE